MLYIDSMFFNERIKVTSFFLLRHNINILIVVREMATDAVRLYFVISYR